MIETTISRAGYHVIWGDFPVMSWCRDQLCKTVSFLYYILPLIALSRIDSLSDRRSLLPPNLCADLVGF